MGNRLFAVCLALLFCPPPLSVSGHTNGTNGTVVLWKCSHAFSNTSEVKKSRIFWQGQPEHNIVLFEYYEGEENFKYQTESFRNRTNIFPHEIQFGNLSLAIKLDWKDDQIPVKVVINPQSENLQICKTTLHVAVSFQKPTVEINRTDMMATCTTKGGYPKPDVKWTSESESLAAEKNPTDIPEENGLYNIVSKVNATGVESLTCSVYNPTSNETVSGSIRVQEKSNLIWIGVGGILGIVVACCLIAGGCFYYRRLKPRQPDRQEPDVAIPLNDRPLQSH